MILHGIDEGVDGGVTHLTHPTQKVDCCLLRQIKKNGYGECQDHGVLNVTKSRSLLSDSAKSNNGKEFDVGVDDCVNNHVDNCVNSHVDDSVNVAVKMVLKMMSMVVKLTSHISHKRLIVV
eukprot:4817807-Ditylum_brightwellii.AAC.1